MHISVVLFLPTFETHTISIIYVGYLIILLTTTASVGSYRVLEDPNIDSLTFTGICASRESDSYRPTKKRENF